MAACIAVCTCPYLRIVEGIRERVAARCVPLVGNTVVVFVGWDVQVVVRYDALVVRAISVPYPP